MDISRKPYTTYARFHTSESAPLIKIRWYVTTLPGINSESVINNRILDEDKWQPLLLGEVPDWVSKQKYNGKWTQPRGLNGAHQCHSDEFATGQPWPYDGPPIKYDDAWIPECCGRKVDAARGGVEVGGAAGDVLKYVDSARGGVEVGGAAGDLGVGIDPAAGGVEIGGAAGDLGVGIDPAAGGVEVGGAAGDIYTPPPAYCDQYIVDGTLVLDTNPAIPNAWFNGDNNLFGPTSLPSGTWFWVPASDDGRYYTTDDWDGQGCRVFTLAFGGGPSTVTICCLHAHTDAAEGGVEIGGDAGDVNANTDGAEGGVEIGGEAGDVFSGGDTPTNDPCTAPFLDSGVEYDFSSSGVPGSVQWIRYHGGTTQIVITATGWDDTTDLDVQLYNGPDCVELYFTTFLGNGPRTVGGGPVEWLIRVECLTSTAVPWSVIAVVT